MSHVLRTLLEIDANTTLLSVDDVGAFDLISRKAMMEGLLDMPNGGKLLPFVRHFHGSPSFLWEDEMVTVNFVPQGKGGEQGDPLMPLHFSLGQHRGLSAVGEVGSSRTRRVRRNKQSIDNCGCSQHLRRGNVEARQDHTSPREDCDLETRATMRQRALKFSKRQPEVDPSAVV